MSLNIRILRQSAKLKIQMFSGPPGNLFSIFTNVVLTSSFVHLCYLRICNEIGTKLEQSVRICNYTRKRVNLYMFICLMYSYIILVL